MPERTTLAAESAPGATLLQRSRRAGATLPHGGLLDATILMVDDQPANLAILSRLLERAGYANLVSTTDPNRALELFEAHRPDLVLLDLHMPGSDGFEVMERLRPLTAAETYLPILILTADATPEAKRRALSMGAMDFLTKPFDVVEVMLRINNLLETRALYLELAERNVRLEARLKAQDHAVDELRVKSARIGLLLDAGGPAAALQPIADLATGRVTGAEALARFEVEPRRAPDVWFGEAQEVGLGAELEISAVRAAVRRVDELPEGAYLSVNVSPPVALLPDFLQAVEDVHPTRLVLEVTEHARIEDYDRLEDGLRPLRERGVRLAVDDAGAGFASLRHILRLRPDYIKLDLSLTRDVDTDPARRALAVALTTFASEIGAAVVAEGIETASELRALRDLGVGYGQGYFLARPSFDPVPAYVAVGSRPTQRTQCATT